MRSVVPPQVIVSPPDLPGDQMMLEGVVLDHPTYSVGETGKFFFARSAVWMRDMERKDRLTLDGQPLEVGRAESGVRRYTLPEIERIAHALAQTGSITGPQLITALRLVQLQAQLWINHGPSPAKRKAKR